MGKRATILDVARHAGVSKSTVSLVLQGSPLVKDRTRAQVEASMAALNYVYNRSAAGLRGAATGLVGLIINDLRNPFFTEFAASAQMALARQGYATVIANTDEDPALQVSVAASMIEHGVSAIMISPAYGDGGGTFERIARAGTPTLQVLRQIDDRTDRFPFASPDYATGGAMATRHLLDLGCRRIAFVGGLADRPVTVERMAGYRREMAAAGLEPRVLPGRPSRAFGRDAARHIAAAARDLEAALCFSDLVALGMLLGFAAAGVTPGRDFRLVGFDDIEEASLAHPALSSVSCGIADFGAEAADTMVRWVDAGDRPPALHRTPVALVPRASSLGA